MVGSGSLSAGTHPAAHMLRILVPVLNRPKNVQPLVDSIVATTAGAHILFICDEGDSAELEALDAVSNYAIEWISPGGNYAEKINAGIAATEEPLLFLGADDLKFWPGWLAESLAVMAKPTGVVGTNDVCNPKVMAGEHATHFLITREYAECGQIDGAPGVLHEGYLHEFVDNELIATARARGAYAHAGRAVVEHLHPMAGKANMDELYAGMPARMKQGEALYKERSPLWA